VIRSLATTPGIEHPIAIECSSPIATGSDAAGRLVVVWPSAQRHPTTGDSNSTPRSLGSNILLDTPHQKRWAAIQPCGHPVPTPGEWFPLVVLLHGFPQTSACWTLLLETLAAAGYRAVAPNQRGYSPTARPATVSAYRVPELFADVVAIADRLDAETFHLVGHDWAGWWPGGWPANSPSGWPP
jgi:pimeloyl-ACP methyl ester carboxylesterase